MNHYETVFILNPVLSEDQVKEAQEMEIQAVAKGKAKGKGNGKGKGKRATQGGNCLQEVGSKHEIVLRPTIYHSVYMDHSENSTRSLRQQRKGKRGRKSRTHRQSSRPR